MKETEMIDDMEFTCHKSPVFANIRLGAKLARTVSPVLASLTGLVDGVESVEDLMKVDLRDAGPVMFALAEALEPKRLEELILESLKSTTVIVDDGGAKVIELNTKSKIDNNVTNIGTLFKAVFFALQTNFGDFIGDALSRISVSKSKAAPSPDPDSAPTLTKTF